MKAIKFKNTAYELMSNINRTPARLQASIVKGDLSLDDVLAEALESTEIQILEDDEVVAVYSGYTKFFTIYFIKSNNKETISVEMINEDIEAQIRELNSAVNDVVVAQNAQTRQINDLSQEISGKLDSNVIGNTETIGSPASKQYETGETFIGSDGIYYKATVPIMTNTILVIGGNCEETNISEEIQNIKGEE